MLQQHSLRCCCSIPNTLPTLLVHEVAMVGFSLAPSSLAYQCQHFIEPDFCPAFRVYKLGSWLECSFKLEQVAAMP